MDGSMVPSDEPLDWRSAGTTKVGKGFELVQDLPNQEGHLLCLVPFESTGSHVYVTLDYLTESQANQSGNGLCIYLMDPAVSGWDCLFDGSGMLGFGGKCGALLGVGLDLSGEFSGVENAVVVKRASDSELLCDPAPVPDGLGTNGEWRNIHVKFDIEDHNIDVKVGGIKLLDDVPIRLGNWADGTQINVPRRLCVAVCAGTGARKTSKICVNRLRLQGEDAEEQ